MKKDRKAGRRRSGRYLSIVSDGARLFWAKGSLDRAAAISFYALFSLIPLMLIVTAGAGFMLGSKAGLLDRVISLTRQSLPYLGDLIIGDLKDLARASSRYGWVGIVFLVWSADLVLAASSDALAAIFSAEKRFGFIKKKAINFLALLLGILAALLSISLTAAAIVFRSVRYELFGIDVSYHVIQSIAFKFILPFLIVTAIVTVAYRVFSGPALNWRYAFYGAALFTLLWEVAKQLFTWYVANFPSYNRIYGSLGTLMILLLWIFYSANLFLFSAAMARAAYDKRVKKAGKKGDEPALAGRTS